MPRKEVLNPDHRKAAAFFRRVLSQSKAPTNARLIVVAHLVDSAVPFLPALGERFRIQAILGKPSSIDRNVQSYLSGDYENVMFELDKEHFRDNPEAFIYDAFPPHDGDEPHPVAIIDIGGYFAPSNMELAAESNRAKLHTLRIRDALRNRGYELRGIVEDTQNGHKRYEDALPAFGPCPGFSIYSVARSPLKKPENHLVGVAVTFSIEALLRGSNIVLPSRRAGVIGFGPIGRSVAHSLRNRGIPVSVCELDPIKLATAAAQGFRVYDYNDHFEDFCRGINLVVSATGAGAKSDGRRPLDSHHIRSLAPRTFVASVTSQDDEIDLDSIRSVGYTETTLDYNRNVSRWTLTAPEGGSAEDSFYLMLGGNAVNFLHQGVVGPAIQLLQGEIIACLDKILTDQVPTICEVLELQDSPDRKNVASAWLAQYMADSIVSD